MPYLTVEIHHDPLYQTSPGYIMYMNWCTAQSLPHDDAWYMEVFDETPVRVEVDMIDLDENNEWIRDPDTNLPTTHHQTFTASVLPPVQGSIYRGGSTAP